MATAVTIHPLALSGAPHHAGALAMALGRGFCWVAGWMEKQGLHQSYLSIGKTITSYSGFLVIIRFATSVA